MKFLIIPSLVAVVAFSAHAGDYYEGTLVFTDGTSKKGLIESTLGTDYVLFKASRDAKVEKVEAPRLKAVTLKGKEKVYEYHLLRVYLGWGQKRISDPMWLEVVEKGIATLYVSRTTMTSQNGLNSAGFQDYYIIRAGEPAAKMIANVSTMNNNQTFKAKAPLYFADYPELAAKIKSKEYTWKDLTLVVQQYNQWAAKNKAGKSKK